VPNRRTYGPALSGKYFDRCIFFGSMSLVLLMILFSALGFQRLIDFSKSIPLSLIIPLLIVSVGIFSNFLVGELDRKKLIKTKSDRPYKFTFILSFGVIVLGIILGWIMNPTAVGSTLSKMPFIAAGVLVFALVCWGILVYSTRGFSIDGKKEPLIV
jgi:hypothetical protein